MTADTGPTFIMRSLQAKIVFVYLALAALIVGLSAVALFEIGRIADKAREGSKVAELADATLEMRRFEKNHFLYGQAGDLEEHARFASRARELLRRDAGAIDALAGPGTATGLDNDLARYTAAIAAHARAPADEPLAAAVRSLGNRVVTIGEHLAARERQSLHAALAAHQRNLLVWLAVVALLLYNSALAEIGPTRAAVYLNLLPVFTMLGAWWLLGDRILPLQVAASLVVIVGVWCTIMPARRRG